MKSHKNQIKKRTYNEMIIQNKERIEENNANNDHIKSICILKRHKIAYTYSIKKVIHILIFYLDY